MNPYDPPREPLSEPPALPTPGPLLVAAVFGVCGVLLSAPFVSMMLGFEDVCALEPVEPDARERLAWTAAAALSSAGGPLLAFRALPAAARTRGGRSGLSVLGTWLAVVGTFALGSLSRSLLAGDGIEALGALLFGGFMGGIVGVVFCLAGLAPWLVLELFLARPAADPR